jgi:transposase-like protein
MITTINPLSALQMARKYDINRKTAWLFMRKYCESLKSSENKPIDNDGGDSVVYVDEFVVGEYEEGKTGRSNDAKKHKIVMVVEATKRNGIKRVYGLKIKNYSSKELQRIFDKHIVLGTEVITDGWKGYNRMNGDYEMVEDKARMQKNNNPMNRIIQQFKSWIRGVYHKSSQEHIESYLNEFSFRINRSLWKETHFHSAILKSITHEPFSKKLIPCAIKV